MAITSSKLICNFSLLSLDTAQRLECAIVTIGLFGKCALERRYCVASNLPRLLAKVLRPSNIRTPHRCSALQLKVSFLIRGHSGHTQATLFSPLFNSNYQRLRAVNLDVLLQQLSVDHTTLWPQQDHFSIFRYQKICFPVSTWFTISFPLTSSFHSHAFGTARLLKWNCWKFQLDRRDHTL